MIRISPSILAGDFARLGEAAQLCERSGADWLHIDVMDGHFVPNITIGAPVVKCLRKTTGLFFDVHLMISEPDRYLPDFAAAGADLITVHAEADGDTEATVDLIRSLGVKAAVALKPATPAETLFPYLDKLDMVLVMTVEPGFGGQSFMADQLPKIAAIRAACEKRGLATDIQVDGGITDKNAPLVIEAGANVLVAGSYLFKAESMERAIERLRREG
ncbi:MAG: ribulose-phosphate 3-epimerase [Clostridia bacterium]|nr:ribulose-phosphate 3-epimerase [Clostridia bacterium]